MDWIKLYHEILDDPKNRIKEHDMKERPILFSTEMVKAILEGRKTQTRRVIKGIDQDCDGLKLVKPNCYAMIWNKTKNPEGGFLELAKIHCPYGQPGDRLWVRETFIPDPPDDDSWDYNMYSDGCIHNMDEIPARFKNPKYVIYRAPLDFGPGLKWQPSIFMPRWASRITLEVVNVRVERVQDISEEDALMEGIESLSGIYELNKALGLSNKSIFEDLWDSINAKRGYSWDANPWVWVVEFEEHKNG